MAVARNDINHEDTKSTKTRTNPWEFVELRVLRDFVVKGANDERRT
jgi:hypothetical protein